MRTIRRELAVVFLVMCYPSVMWGGVLSVRLEVRDPVFGLPVSSVNVGDSFVLLAWVNDERQEARGIKSVYVDTAFDASRVSASGDFGFYGSEDFQSLRSGTVAHGLLDEVGGTQMDVFTGREGLLFSMLFTAVSPGAVTFSPDMADDFPLHCTLFEGAYGSIPLVATGATGQNQSLPLDVNADSLVTPIDVLFGINALNADGARPYEKDPPYLPPFLDVDGDGYHTFRDVQLGVNYLRDGLTFADPVLEVDVDFYPATIDIVTRPEPVIYVLYNNSSWDNSSGSTDDDAIAPDKAALRPGSRAAFANYTNCDQGINGLVIDVPGLLGAPTVNDFLFRLGNDDEPYGDDLYDPADDWPCAPDPLAITLRPGAGQDGADRLTLIWEDGVIRNCWLQVTLLATDVTGLTGNAVFYIGNAVGESGNSSADAVVNATDEIGARNNPHSPFNPAQIDDPYDFNRDKLVNATDQIIARNHRTSPFTALKLITPPQEPAGDGGRGE